MENNKNNKETAKNKGTKKNEYDVDSLIDSNLKKEDKSSLSFNQNKSIADKLSHIAEVKKEKVGSVLNAILKGVVDTENKKCKVDIKEISEEKIQNSYKINKDVLEVLKMEAASRNMSINDYLNKVLAVVLKDVK